MLDWRCRYALALLLTVLGFATSSAAQDKKPYTINLGYSAISGSFAPLWVGFDQGLFSKHGFGDITGFVQAFNE